jgi:hypothetical protein
MNPKTSFNYLRFAPFIIAMLGTQPTLGDDAWHVSNLGPPVNTSDYEAFPTISKDGLALYFARASAKKKDGTDAETFWDTDDWDIYVSTRSSTDSRWGMPQKLPDHINTGGEDHSVSFSPDGHWMYFSSTELDGCGGLDIFRSYREDVTDHFGWQAPENLGCEVNTQAHDVCVIYHQEDESGRAGLYFVSNREGAKGSLDIWRVGFDPTTGVYDPAEHLDAISSPGFDGHLDPEAGYIWTIRDGGYGGSDIWRASRDSEGKFVDPVNLGPEINTAYEEQMPSPVDHGRAFYLASDRPGGEGNLDIYLAEMSVD